MRKARSELNAVNPFLAALIATKDNAAPCCERCKQAATHWLGIEKTRWFCKSCWNEREAEHERKQGWLYEAHERRRNRTPTPHAGGTDA